MIWSSLSPCTILNPILLTCLKTIEYSMLWIISCILKSCQVSWLWHGLIKHDIAHITAMIKAQCRWDFESTEYLLWLVETEEQIQVSINYLAIIGSDTGLSPVRRQAFIWSNTGLLLIGLLGTNFSEIWTEIHVMRHDCICFALKILQVIFSHTATNSSADMSMA